MLSLTHSGLMVMLGMVTLRHCHSCSAPYGYKKPTTTEKILRAPIVVLGRVQRTYADPQFEHTAPGSVYTALMDIHCVLKGPPIPRYFNISQAGEIPGHCSATMLVAGNSYFVLLNNQFLPQGLDFTEIDVTETNIRDVTRACGLTPQYPFGLDSGTAVVPCPEVADDADCISETMVSTHTHRSHGISNDTSHSLIASMYYGGVVSQHHVTAHQPITLLLTTGLIISITYLLSAGS